MSALTSDAVIDVARTPRVPFARLVGIELRKMGDTRAGRWLIGITTGILVLAVVGTLVIAVLNDRPVSFSLWITVLTVPLSLFLPTIAILSITQEWGQRTALTTFALEPRRLRIVAAKLLAVLGLAAATLLLAVLLAPVGNVAFELMSGHDAGWDVDGTRLGWSLYSQLAVFIMAFGLGALLLSSPAAIVIYYVVSLLLPMMVTGAIYTIASWGPDVVPWFDLTFAIAPFLQPEMPRPDHAVAQLVVATTLWVVLPLALGMLRIRRVELK